VITNLASIDGRVQRVLNDSSFDCIAVSNMQGIIQGVNQTLVREFRYLLKEDLVGQKLQRMIIGGGDAIRNNHDAFIANFSPKSKEERNSSTVLGKQRILYARRADGSEFQCIVGVHMIEGTELLAGFIRNLD
jgi:PAS domain-containing protein